RAPGRGLPCRGRSRRRRVLDPARVEGRAPAALVVSGQLHVVPLVNHPGHDGADARPAVEPGPQGAERRMGGHAAEPGEPEDRERSPEPVPGPRPPQQTTELRARQPVRVGQPGPREIVPMSRVQRYSYFIQNLEQLPLHLRDRVPFILPNTEALLRKPEAEV